MDIDDIIRKCRDQQAIAGCPDAAVMFELSVELEPPAFGQQAEAWEGGPVGDVVDYQYGFKVAKVVFAADEMIDALEKFRRVRNG